MNEDQPHRWDVTPAAARALQELLRHKVITSDALDHVRTVAGVDVGFEDGGTITRAAVAVLGWPSLALENHAIARSPTVFPYIPGLLSFRETPTILAALAQLATLPDLILCDGQGLIHPRRFGLACHLGVLVDRPTIGVGKTHYIGTFEPVPDEAGAWQPLYDRGEVIGAVVRTRAGTRPIYVSIGHRISLPTAIHYVLGCTTRYRLPETTRWAHRLASGPEL